MSYQPPVPELKELPAIEDAKASGLRLQGTLPKALPKMKINSEIKDIYGFHYEDFKLENYDPHPSIKAPIAV